MAQTETILTPKVDSAQEFIEIALDFSNPLDLVREAISNAFDAHAENITLEFSVIQEYGEKVLKIVIKDDGDGMDTEGLQSFFDLGNSLRRGNDDSIGEKGHGTKVYFNSKKIEVLTQKNNYKFYAIMDEPSRKLLDREIPEVNLKIEDDPSGESGTTITILGYNNNRRDRFTHDQIKDYILWFTKFGSIESAFRIEKYKNVKLHLKGVDKREFESIQFGHVFPEESQRATDLFDKYFTEAPKWYCKKFVRTGTLESMPEIEYQAIFVVEGTRVKYQYNNMIKRSGYKAPQGAYTVQERYGLWLCKDFIPVQRKNEWITVKGSEYTKFHAFVNCQDLRLTANRGSIENTHSEILLELKKAVDEVYNEIQNSDWEEIQWLESAATAYKTIDSENKDFERRIEKTKRARVADYNGIHLIEPQMESGVFAIFMQLSSHDPGMFPFTIINYDTHSGIDVIAKAKDDIPIKTSKLYYVEFKNYLTKDFNHSFKNLHSIVCWDINLEVLGNGEEVTDIANQRRTLKIIPPADDRDYTRYYLDSMRSERKIEIFVLKYYLEQKFNIKFLPRTETASI